VDNEGTKKSQRQIFVMIAIGKDNFQVFGSDGLKIVNRRIYIYIKA